MPNSVEEINSLRQLISRVIFGDKNDKVLNCINTFMMHLDNFRIVLIQNHFPALVVHLVYYPLFFLVMLLNCLKEMFMWWITVIILFGVFLAAVGALFTVCFLAYRGYTIYTERFDESG